ncbi:MAG: hypothetical protein IPG42_20895 [Betaproteobacteria bacterium]|nr:hypothetical protein [Betaproteobacteria bacterium]
MPDTPDPLIPSGRFCYRLEPITPGEVMANDLERYGKDLREHSYGGGMKQVLCPYWIRTDHGTVRCEKMNR